MLNIRKYLITALPLKNVVFHSTKTHKRQTLPTKNKRLRNRSDVFYQRNFGPNPGLDQQLNSLQLKDMEIQNKKEVLHPDVVENFEKQFWDSDKMHDMMERENSMYHEALGLQQVMRKHFKTEKNPNMLLYDEKLAIKALHNEDPEKWTVMKLAFSFPASPPIIKKILKTNVKLRSQAEIQKHDQRVRRNWEALAKDKLTVSDKDLKDHLISFSNRSKLTETSREMTAISNNRSEENPLKKVLCDEGVFSNIYKSYKNLHHPESKNEASTSQKTNNVIEEGLKMLYHPPKNDTFILPKSVQRHKSSTTEHMTLKEMRKRDSLLSSNQTGLHDNDRGTVLNEDWISNREHNLPKLEDPIGIALGKEKQNHTFEDKDEVSLEISGTNDGLLPTGKKGTVSQNASKYVDMEKLSELEKRHMENLKNMIQTAKLKRSEDDSDAIAKAVKSYVHNSSESYPLNIKIPDDLKRKGVLYRIKDRFYTDDGEFLFRVPGLLKQ